MSLARGLAHALVFAVLVAACSDSPSAGDDSGATDARLEDTALEDAQVDADSSDSRFEDDADTAPDTPSDTDPGDARDAPEDSSSDVRADAPSDLPSADATGDVTPDTGPPGVEICGDGIDNDFDGVVDEGCAPPVGTWVGQFAFVGLPGAGGGIYMMRVDGSDRREIVVGPPSRSSSYQGLEWSSDGAWLAYEVVSPSGTEIRRTNLDGSVIVTVGAGTRPHFMPDSDELVFVGADGVLARTDHDGAELTTYGLAEEGLPLPDGSAIVSVFLIDGSTELSVHAVDGSTRRGVGSGFVPSPPLSVSADSLWVAAPDASSGDLRVQAIDESTFRVVEARAELPEISHSDFAEAGTLIAFDASRGGGAIQQRTYSLDPLAPAARRIDLGRGGIPEFAPDGSSLLASFGSAIVLDNPAAEEQFFMVSGRHAAWHPVALEPTPSDDERACKLKLAFNEFGLQNEFSRTGDRWIGFRLDAPETMTVSEISFFTGEVAGRTVVEIRDNDPALDAPVPIALAASGFDQEVFVGWQTAEFARPVRLTGGETYWIVTLFPEGSQTMFALDGDTRVTYRGADSTTGPWDGPYDNWVMMTLTFCR